MKTNNKQEKFQNLSVNNFWLPLTQQLIDNHNTAMKLSNNDDEKYCKCMMMMSSLLLPGYGRYIDLFRLNQVFIYIIEFILGNPYEDSGKIIKTSITTFEMFNLIKKYWNVNINSELKKVNKVKNQINLFN